MAVIQFDSLHFIDTPGGNAGVAVATRGRGASEVSVIRQKQEPGGFNPVHTHDREEVLIMLSGTIEVVVTGDAQVLQVGDAVIIPAHTDHQLRNTGPEPAEWLLVATAGVRFFHASGEEATPPWAH